MTLIFFPPTGAKSRTCHSNWTWENNLIRAHSEKSKGLNNLSSLWSSCVGLYMWLHAISIVLFKHVRYLERLYVIFNVYWFQEQHSGITFSRSKCVSKCLSLQFNSLIIFGRKLTRKRLSQCISVKNILLFAINKYWMYAL